MGKSILSKNREEFKMGEAIQKFVDLGKACPDCGKEPILTGLRSLINEREQGLLWQCDHLLEDGKTYRVKVAALYFKVINDGDLKKVVDIVQGERNLDDVPRVEGEFKQYDVTSQLFDCYVEILAKQHGVNLDGYRDEKRSYDFKPIWNAIVPNMSDDDLVAWLETRTDNPSSRVVTMMREVLVAEHERRGAIRKGVSSLDERTDSSQSMTIDRFVRLSNVCPSCGNHMEFRSSDGRRRCRNIDLRWECPSCSETKHRMKLTFDEFLEKTKNFRFQCTIYDMMYRHTEGIDVSHDTINLYSFGIYCDYTTHYENYTTGKKLVQKVDGWAAETKSLFDNASNVEGQFRYAIIQLSRRVGIDIRKHIQNNVFDIRLWWDEFVDKATTADLEAFVNNSDDTNEHVSKGLDSLYNSVEKELISRKRSHVQCANEA
ncbi:hypothetical protein JZ785_27675 (plasmid) [Alicyclobacillus curvatus]|nr:hypothetical protein JZ785_27675 [Alicyclobacillus curvatus]